MQKKWLAIFTLGQVFLACTTREHNETPDSSAHDVFTSVQKRSLIDCKVVGTAVSLRDKLYAPFKTCNVPNGTDVKIAHFQDGFFKAKKPVACASLSGDSAWIHAGSVEVPRNSYSGLRELNSNSAVTVAMNYADNKIFCTSGKCLINSALYAQNRCFLRDAPARALQNAAIDLQKRKGRVGSSALSTATAPHTCKSGCGISCAILNGFPSSIVSLETSRNTTEDSPPTSLSK